MIRNGGALYSFSLFLAFLVFLTSLHSYLTNSISTLERFPISFKTQFSGGCFRHIVLGLYCNGYFGAVGISRREDLMYKPLHYRTLSDLLVDFQEAYTRCWHTLRKVKIGPFVSHDPHSVEQIDWKHSVVDVQELSAEGLRRELERHSREMRLRVRKGTRVSMRWVGAWNSGCPIV